MKRRPDKKRTIYPAAIKCAAALFFFSLQACGKQQGHSRDKEQDPPKTLEVDMSRKPIDVQFTASPAVVRLDRDVIVTVRIVAPSETRVDPISLDDRLSGFVPGGTYSEGPVTENGKTAVEYHVRLTPVVSEEYRIAPFAVTYTDHGSSPPRTGWFATRPVVFESQPPFEGDAGKKVSADLDPVWIYPPPATIFAYFLMFAGAVFAVVALWKLTRRARRRIRLMQMSPGERALHEITELLNRKLVEKNMVKEFYIALTMIVRSYIERKHRIRAPEQTTEEFLSAVSSDPRFASETAGKLKEFMKASDLVKFAAHKPAEEDIDAAIDTARRYIETDTSAGTERLNGSSHD